jgi:ribosomal protein S18 acetylase RimI-like enzyme
MCPAHQSLRNKLNKGIYLKLNGISAQNGLNETQTTQLHVLAATCSEADGVDIKFNYSMIANRKSSDLSDFCWNHDGRLVGYVPLDRFGRKGEITAAVDPAHRRDGIFTTLYTAAVEQAKLQECTELLLVNYRESKSGNAVVRRLGLPYKVSEYCMTACSEGIVDLPDRDVVLIEVTPEHVDTLSRMLAISFPGSGWRASEELLEELRDPAKSYFLAQVSGQTVGHIGVSTSEKDTYIRGVGILPEWRRRGYGRQMLASVLRMQIEAGARNFELDVATENESALSIYTSCGFHKSNVYDYYLVF